MKKKQVLRFGLPKGSLQEATIEKMAKAGFNITVSSRSYIPYVDDEDLEIRLIRAQEISRYVEHGYLDCGITGYDWIQENGSKVHEVGEFQFNKATRQTARWVLAVPEDSPIRSVKDLQGKRIATELVQVTKDYFSKKKVPVKVEFSWGATEVKPPRLVDAIVDITETGSSLRANRLRIIDPHSQCVPGDLEICRQHPATRVRSAQPGITQHFMTGAINNRQRCWVKKPTFCR